jgi:hypothetical protein
MSDIVKKNKKDNYLSEERFTNYLSNYHKVSDESAFEKYKAHRQQTIGGLLPLPVKILLEKSEKEELQILIDKVKSLSFFSDGYIDNFIIYFEVLKNPVLSADYLEKIIDRYVKPDIRLQGARPFHKFVIGYFCHEMEKNGSSKAMPSKIMAKHFSFSQKEIDSSIKDYKSVCNHIEKDDETYFIADFFALMLLYQTDFDLENSLKPLGNHHHTLKSKEAFLKAYKVYSERICKTYIPYIRNDFSNPPLFLDEIILPELKQYIVDFDSDNCVCQEINMLSGIVLSFAFMSLAPDLMNNKEKLNEIGLLTS